MVYCASTDAHVQITSADSSTADRLAIILTIPVILPALFSVFVFIIRLITRGPDGADNLFNIIIYFSRPSWRGCEVS